MSKYESLPKEITRSYGKNKCLFSLSDKDYTDIWTDTQTVR
jgi:hypothetical protein